MLTKEIKFLLTHSSIYGLGTVLSRLVSFILLPLYTRYLTVSDYGLLELIDITSGIIGLVVTVGISNALSRFYYEFEKQKERNNVVSTTYITYFTLACFAAPILFFLSTPIAKILPISENYAGFFKISFATLLVGGTIDVGLMYLRLIKKSFIFIIITTTRLLLLIISNIIFIVYLEMGVLGILYSSLFVGCLYALVITSLIFWKTRITFSLKTCLDMLKYSLPLIPSNLASTFVKFSDRYFIIYFVSIAEMGIYSLALKLGVAIHSLLTIPFNLAYIPRRFEIMNRPDAKDIFSRIFTYHIFLIVFIGMFLSILLPEILSVMVTPEFFRAGMFVPMIICSMIIYSFQSHFNFGILYSRKTIYLAYINLITAVLNLGLNFILILQYGIWGAIFSYFIVVSLQAVLFYYVSYKLYPIDFEFNRLLKYIILALLFYIISGQINSDLILLNLSFKLIILASFPIIVVLFKIILPEEIVTLRGFFTNAIKSPS